MQLQEDIYTSGGVQTHTLCNSLKETDTYGNRDKNLGNN